MSKIDVFNLEAKKVKELELADVVFGIEPNNQAIFDAVLLQQASLRQGTHSTKTRAEVSGGGRKPFRQKGTGRARQGSTRAVQMRHGGIAFGPKPRTYGFKLNRKVRRLALRSVLSQKVQNDSLRVLENLQFEQIKTKDFKAVMDKFGFDKKTLFVVDVAENFENAFLSLRNIPNAMLLTVETLSVYEIANADCLVMTEAAAVKAGEVFA